MNKLTFQKKDVTFKRRLTTVNKDVYKMVQTIDAKNKFLATMVTAKNWIVTEIRSPNSQYQFYVDDSLIAINERTFLLYIPPFSLVQFMIGPGTSCSTGYALRKPPLASHSFVTADIGFRRLVEGGFDRTMLVGKNIVDVTRRSNPTRLSLSAKAIMDHSLLTPVSLGMIARKFKTSPEVLSRTFKKDFGISPVEYRARLRISAAIGQLVYGATILETAFGVGFADLSRFYKQFKRITSLPPGKYKI